MMQKLGPALIGAALGMLLFWGMSKYLGAGAPHGAPLPTASIALPPLTPVDAPAEGQLSAGIRGAEDPTLTAGIRGTDTSQMVGSMTDQASASAPSPAQPCFDHEAVPRLVVAPDYPYAARVGGQDGEVALEFTVGADGTVGEVAVVSAQPPEVFDQAAQDAVRQWRFDPRTSNCAAVAARVRQVLHFRLGAGG